MIKKQQLNNKHSRKLFDYFGEGISKIYVNGQQLHYQPNPTNVNSTLDGIKNEWERN